MWVDALCNLPWLCVPAHYCLCLRDLIKMWYRDLVALNSSSCDRGRLLDVQHAVHHLSIPLSIVCGQTGSSFSLFVRVGLFLELTDSEQLVSVLS